MNATQYKEYFSREFQGMKDALDKVFTPIFGEFTPNEIPTANDYVIEYGNGGANIDHIYDYGTYYTDSTNVSVFEVVLSDNCQISRARKNIQNTVRKITDRYAGAFIIFHYAEGSNNSEAHTWRLSWLKRLDVHRKDSPAKRYTYLCGPSYSCRTIAQRFDELQKTSSKTLDSITKAFDVEALSDEFFKEYKVMYDDIVQWITGQRIIKKDGKWELNGRFGTGKGNGVLEEFMEKISSDEEVVTKAVRDYVKKLLGRLVFIQFLQKKEWLKIDGTISTNFLLALFNVIDEKSKDNFIEAALERVVYLLLNNENRVKDSEIIDHHKLDVPFLNGGLFERDQYDNLEIKLPKEFFHNETYKEEKRELSETRLRDNDNFFTQCGILDLFNQYNFTIDENDPNDAEMGVDPEMLGKIFENLLEDNKDKGAFYTPKEIVQYMCNESLIAYLQTKVPNYDDEIRQFVLDAEQKDVPEKEKILDALQEVKICDPAIGSGAFPMGLLNLLVALREKLESSTQRVELKKSIIQNNIYGVDIEKGAIDIARLRFWLSIMVDEEKPTPLPNFEYKFMQGNSLLENFKGTDLSQISVDTEVETYNSTSKKKKNDNNISSKTAQARFSFSEEDDKYNLQLNLNLYFKETNHAKKESLRCGINDCVKSYIKKQGVSSIDERVIDEIDPSANDRFFLWHTWFADVFKKGGFDIVIGNPPYGVSIKGEYRNTVVASLGNVPDYEIYYYFIQIASRLLKSHGILSYIVPNTWLFNTYAKNYRLSVLLEWNLNEILDCSKFKIFSSATVYNSILLLCKTSNVNNHVIYRPTANAKTFGELIVENRLCITKDSLRRMNQNWGLAFSLPLNKIKIVNKCADLAKPISFYFPEISQGLIAYDKYQGQSEDIIRRRAYHYMEFKEGLKKWLWGEDIRRYQLLWNQKEYIDYCDGIANPRQPKFFHGKRLLIREITNPSIYATIVTEELYNDPAIIIVKDNESYSLELVLAILNSKLGSFYHFNHSPKATKGAFPKLLVQDIKDFPIPTMELSINNSIVALVIQILASKKSDPQTDTTTLERKIDVLVYLLYGLTWDEVQVVENSSVHAALPVNEVAYTQWLERYQKDGTLPSEEEMEHMA